MKKSGYLLIILAAVLVIAAVVYIIIDLQPKISAQEKACTNSGGTVVTSSCCKSVDAFPNSCTIGACGCSLQGSHKVKACDCGEGMCFNGTLCVVQG